MPPQQSDGLLDILNQLFRFGAHESSVRLVGWPDLAIAQAGRNPSFRERLPHAPDVSLRKTGGVK
jgi:hypothetical protein